MIWTPETLAQKVLTISSLPTVYMQLVDTANDPQSTTHDLVAIVSEDIGLSVRLMKLVNSSLFGYPSKVDSLSRAIAIIGIKQLQDLALATSIIDTFSHIPNTLVTMESFWKHSIACGVVARILANYRREFNVERAFVSGLLHDIGRLIMLMLIPDEAKQAFDMAESQDQLLYQAETQVLGFNHATLGGVLLKQWQLPEQIIAAVKYHHDPLAEGQFKVDAALIHVADIIVNGLAISSSGEKRVPPLNSDAWELLGLSVSVMETLVSDVEQQYQASLDIILAGAD